VGALRSGLRLAEAFGFTAVVLIDIWFLRIRSAWWDTLPTIFAFVSCVAHRETLGSLGLRMRELTADLRAWRFPLVAVAAAVIWGCFQADRPWYLLYRGVLYFLWCILQQFLLQNMIYRRIRDAIGASWSAWLLTGVMFAATHVPNPVLVPATLVWGVYTAFLFEQRPSVVAIALVQTLFSTLLLWLTPLGPSNQFRVGPGYWHRK
jgi:Type II CAAX prenyl endopeptidase Rce1-like